MAEEENSNQTEQPQVDNFKPVSHSQEVAKHNKRRKLVRVLALLLVIVLAGGTYYYIKHPDTPYSSGNQSVSEEPVNELATEAAVSVKAAGMDPATVRVSPGGVVTWTNDDTANHTLVFTGNDDYDSDALKTKDTYSVTFDTAGEYQYHDSANANIMGTVIVQ